MQLSSWFDHDNVYYKVTAIDFDGLEWSLLRVFACPYWYERKNRNKIYSRLYLVKKADVDFYTSEYRKYNYLLSPAGAKGIVKELEKLPGDFSRAVMIADIIFDVTPLETNDAKIHKKTNLEEIIGLA